MVAERPVEIARRIIKKADNLLTRATLSSTLAIAALAILPTPSQAAPHEQGSWTTDAVGVTNLATDHIVAPLSTAPGILLEATAGCIGPGQIEASVAVRRMGPQPQNILVLAMDLADRRVVPLLYSRVGQPIAGLRFQGTLGDPTLGGEPLLLRPSRYAVIALPASEAGPIPLPARNAQPLSVVLMDTPLAC